MELILWRHAEAEAGAADLARRLTPKGRKQAKNMAAWLNARLPDECRILSSPAARVLETAQALGRKIETIPSLAPGADVRTILETAGWPGGSGDWVLVAGHQPDLGLAAARLLGAQVELSIRKGGIWWFSGRNHDEAAVLRAVLAPDLL